MFYYKHSPFYTAVNHVIRNKRGEGAMFISALTSIELFIKSIFRLLAVPPWFKKQKSPRKACKFRELFVSLQHRFSPRVVSAQLMPEGGGRSYI